MKIEGSYELSAPREQVWEALHDPRCLTETIPGCEELSGTGNGEYRAVIKVGVASVKGRFQGKVRLSELEPPHRYRMTVEGSGGPGFVRGEAMMELTEAPGGTRVAYTADVHVGGLMASVGQRMLGGVAKLTVDQFFSALAGQLRGKPVKP